MTNRRNPLRESSRAPAPDLAARVPSQPRAAVHACDGLPLRVIWAAPARSAFAAHELTMLRVIARL